MELLMQQADQWDTALRGPKMSDASGRVIFKYQMPVLERFTMRLPKGAEIIRMTDQGGMFWLWAVVDTSQPDEDRHFHAYKCGGQMPPVAEDYTIYYTYPEKTLLRLDQTVLHAVNPDVQAGVRTFLKVSISDRPYALKGNSINHGLPDHPRPTEDRQVTRNCPRGIAA